MHRQQSSPSANKSHVPAAQPGTSLIDTMFSLQRSVKPPAGIKSYGNLLNNFVKKNSGGVSDRGAFMDDFRKLCEMGALTAHDLPSRPTPEEFVLELSAYVEQKSGVALRQLKFVAEKALAKTPSITSTIRTARTSHTSVSAAAGDHHYKNTSIHNSTAVGRMDGTPSGGHSGKRLREEDLQRIPSATRSPMLRPRPAGGISPVILPSKSPMLMASLPKLSSSSSELAPCQKPWALPIPSVGGQTALERVAFNSLPASQELKLHRALDCKNSSTATKTLQRIQYLEDEAPVVDTVDLVLDLALNGEKLCLHRDRSEGLATVHRDIMSAIVHAGVSRVEGLKKKE